MAEFYAEASFPLDRDDAGAAFARLFGQPVLGGAWLVEWDDQLAGYIVLTVTFSMEYGGLSAFIDDLFVRPAFRGRGCGRLAMDAVLAECRRRGVLAVHLEVGRGNHAAQSLYAERGFRDNDRQLLTVKLA